AHARHRPQEVRSVRPTAPRSPGRRRSGPPLPAPALPGRHGLLRPAQRRGPRRRPAPARQRTPTGRQARGPRVRHPEVAAVAGPLPLLLPAPAPLDRPPDLPPGIGLLLSPQFGPRLPPAPGIPRPP